jgi:hypothetical protein
VIKFKHKPPPFLTKNDTEAQADIEFNLIHLIIQLFLNQAAEDGIHSKQVQR